jgi:hypothetical protein
VPVENPAKRACVSLGFESYRDYLRSHSWFKLRDRYWASPDTPKACMCGETEGLELHHKTYHRVGEEKLSDLLPLCGNCHAMIHVLERRGEVGLDLSGFESTERAAQYAAERAERLNALIEPEQRIEVPLWYRVMMIERNPQSRNENRWRSLVGRVIAVEKVLHPK